MSFLEIVAIFQCNATLQEAELRGSKTDQAVNMERRLDVSVSSEHL